MQYISPYKLFNCSTIEVLQLKVAQFGDLDERFSDINDDEFVHVFGTKLKKRDLCLLMKELSDARLMSYHTSIFNHKSLLNFLEYGHVNLFRNNVDLSSYPSDFLSFIYPYFKFQFDEAMEYALKIRDSQTLELLSAFDRNVFSGEQPEENMDSSDKNEQLDDYVRERFENLKGLKERENLFSISEKELVSYLSNKCIDVYNALPDYYSQLRNDIAKEAISLSKILMDDYGRSDGATAILRQGVKLKMDEALKSQMELMLSDQQVKTKIPKFIIWAAMAICSLYFLKFLETIFSNS